MTIDQRKIELINWITNLEDEAVITQIESCRQTSIDSLPKEIVDLLDKSANETIEDCIEHISSRNILKMRD